MRSARRWHTITPEINTDDNILRSLRSLRSLFHSLQSLLHSLHRSKENILHRSKVNSPHNILHSKHVCRLDDKPGERADGRVHNSTVHELVTALAVAPQGLHSLATIEARRALQPITRH